MILPSLLFATATLLEPATARTVVTERNLGLALLEQERPADAEAHFEKLAKLLPDDPIGAADAGLAALRAADLTAAEQWFRKAVETAPDDARVHALLAAWHEQGNRNDKAAAEYERAIALDPNDVESSYRLARLLTHIGRDQNRPRIRQLYAELARKRPENPVVLLRHGEAELSAGALDQALVAYRHVAVIVAAADAKSRAQLDQGIAFLAEGKTREAIPKLKIFENLQKSTATYQQALREVFTNVQGIPLTELTAASRARFPAAPLPETALRFVPIEGGGGAASALTAGIDGVLADEAGTIAAITVGRKGVERTTMAEPGADPVRDLDLVLADLDGDTEPDLFVLRGETLTALRGGKEGHFAEAPIQGVSAVPGAVAVRPIDVDLDGDLDLLILSPKGCRLFRNDRDGSFVERAAASGLDGPARAAAVLDADQDGVVDLVLLDDGGRPHLLENRRQGRFVDATEAAGLAASGAGFAAVAAGDLDGDGWPEIVLGGLNGVAVLENSGGRFAARANAPTAGKVHALALFDADNDGDLDLVAAGEKTAVFRNGANGWSPIELATAPELAKVVPTDVDGDGDLDLVGIDSDRKLRILSNDGGNANAWLEVRLETLEQGSGKINRLGYGATVEVEAGRLSVARLVDAPVTWVGLGTERKADVVRVVWPNGVPQSAIDVDGKQRVLEVEQLKGSCPFLYAWNGQRFGFVTDILGRSPLGLLYDGVHLMPAATTEWLPLRADELAPRADGRLDLRVTEELWETVYLDRVTLFAVDHPAGTELVADEKMIPPPFAPKRLDVVAEPRPVAAAADTDGADVTELLATADGRFVADFDRSAYQGIASREHRLVLDLGPEAAAAVRRGEAPTLYLTGWIFYTDTSINVAIAQDSRVDPEAPILEVPDGAGGWKTAIPAMGFPSGKTKTMPVDLGGILDPADPRVRIRTNLAIYWDRIFWSTERNAPSRKTEVPLASADLSERGFSRLLRRVPNGPQVFDYDDVDPVIPRWRDMIGSYTALGDVRDLLLATDDRYAVFKGGDEVALEFDGGGLPAVPDGWVRDWLFVSDGWDKDADLNTVTGDTVLPLPFHAMTTYPYGPDEHFPDDPAHREFVRRTLTRAVDGEAFRQRVRGR